MMSETPVGPPIDRDVVTRLSRDLAHGQTNSVKSLFTEAGASAPHIVWNPIAADVSHPILANFLRLARAAADSEGNVPAAWLESESFAGFRNSTMVLEAIGTGEDFRYCHYGTNVATSYGRSLEGHRTSEIGGHISVFFLALYQAVLTRGEIVKSLHEPPMQVFARKWRRLIVPLHDSPGGVARIAVLSIADNDLRAGLEALPTAVMVVDSAGLMCFANRAACDLFDRSRNMPSGMALSEFTRLDVALPQSPEAMIRLGHGPALRHLLVRSGLILPLKVTIGATLYREKPFYVVSARTEDE